MLDLKLQGKKPIYEQLYTQISLQIAGGEIAPGEKLPAVREIAKQLGINPNTVQKSYAMLEQAGLINSMPAKGSYASLSPSGADGLRQEALGALSQAMEEAHRSGVKGEDAQELLLKVWGEDNNDKH